MTGEVPAGDPGPGGDLRDDPLLQCLAIITRLHGQPVSAEALAAGVSLDDKGFTPARFVETAAERGYAARILRRPLGRIPPLVLPAVLLLHDGAVVLTAMAGDEATFITPESGFGEARRPRAELEQAYTGHCIFIQPLARPEPGTEPAEETRGHWLWGTLWRFRGYYFEAIAAAALVNLLTIATSLFVMNVYDRVVPNHAFDTLLVLAAGTLMAIAFEFLARNLRAWFLESAGRRADVLLAGALFRHALGLRMEQRPPSTGAFAAHLREFESLRDFSASATLATLTDLPFIFLFIWIISLIGGPLYQIPMVAVALVLLIGLIAQWPLGRIMRRHLRESALKHGVLVESVEGMETLKLNNAEGTVQGRWENYTALTGRSAASSRLLSGFVVNVTMLVQQCVTIAIVFWGVYLIAAGELTVGALIACVILAGRGLAPLGQVSGLLMRYQHARAALENLDDLMGREVERPPRRRFLHRPKLAGGFEFRDLSFTYPGQQTPALREVNLTIAPGERVGILGRVGSGKSTLLKLMAGLYRPTAGTLAVDGADIQQLDPADLRRNMGFVSQDVRLFSGTLRDNITLGRPFADDGAVLAAARITGLDRLAGEHPMGFEMPVGEHGDGLSGGQRQMVGLTAALLGDPAMLLLDEPTSAMDHSTEQALLARLRPYLEGRTVVLVTHKPSMLGLVDRLVVLDAGRVLADGARDEVLRALTQAAK